MNGALQLGPLSLSYQLLLVFAAVALGSFVARRLGRRAGVDAEAPFFRLFLLAALTARLAFVLQFREAYLAAPLSMIDIRDGGWSPLAGIVAAWGYALFLSSRRPVLRKPVTGAMAAATAFWLTGAITLALWPAGAAPLPTLNLSRLDGRPVALADFKGQPMVVNLWASWCPPCRREMPALAQAQAAHPEVHFVFLNQGESAAKVEQFLAAQNLPLRNVLLDAGQQAPKLFGQRALPTTLFFDAQGQLVDTRVGELSRATLAQRLQALTDRASGSASGQAGAERPR